MPMQANGSIEPTAHGKPWARPMSNVERQTSSRLNGGKGADAIGNW